jgi:hypothetical protein
MPKTNKVYLVVYRLKGVDDKWLVIEDILKV